MECVYGILSEYCVRTNRSLTKPVVVCCVPGFGKTTIIKLLIALKQCNIVSGTGATTDRLKSITYSDGVDPQAELNILDEFQTYKGELGIFDVVLGDPDQTTPEHRKDLPKPHFIGTVSRRLGQNTTALLSAIGYNITSECSGDVVTFEDPYVVDPVGQVVIFQERVADLLRKHSIQFKSALEIQGLEFASVSVYVEYPICSCELHSLYIALTRHRRSLTIFLLNANPATKRSFEEHIIGISRNCYGDCHKSTTITLFTSWWRSISQAAIRWFV
nr:triple gene block 1 [Caper latent virus]